ncbi:MAG: alpha/beta hydrolase [Bacillota bacterium]
MRHSEFGWMTGDGLKIFAREWMPKEVNPKGIVCLVHGFGEHSGRYPHLAEHLTAEGYGIFSFDLRGHGKSGGQRGHTPGYEAFMDDISLLLKEARQRHPDIPGFLYGHSMGGNLVLNYALRKRPEIKGVIATSPWLRLTTPPPAIAVALGRIISIFNPASSRSNNLDSKGLSHDPEVVSAYDKDPLVNRLISLKTFISITDSGRWALDNAAGFSLPLLLMHGSADPVTCPKASEEFAGKAAGNCTLKIWEGLYHETHNEPQQKDIFSFVTQWLNKHL